MWPMSHALYPGLNDKLERPSTSDSHKTWYGNNRKSYASSTGSFQWDKRSIRSVAPEEEAQGEDLGELINRSRKAFSVLSADADKQSQRGQARQYLESRGGAESNNDMMGKDNESVVHGEDSWQGPHAPLGRSELEADTSSHRFATELSTPRSPGATAANSVFRSSVNSTVVSLPSPNTTVPQSRASLQSLRAKPSAGAGPHGLNGWNPQTPRHLTESSPLLNAEAVHSSKTSVAASNKASSDDSIGTPEDDSTAAPSDAPSLAGDTFSEKKPEAVHIRPLISDDEISRPGSASDMRGSDQEKNTQPEGQAGAAEEDEDDTANHLTGMPLVLVTIALSAAVFLVAMDVNVIATAIPRITGEFRSLDDVGWYGAAFLMATCATQIPYGRIYSLFPAKWVFTSAIFIFMVGSLVAAVSPSSPVLIFGRAIQGTGTSGILSGGLIIMSQVVSLRLRPLITSCVGAMEGIAMVSAPVIGGILTDQLHWRWCFYINLPIGGFALLTVLLCLRNVKTKTPQRKAAGMTVWQTLYELDVLGGVILLPPIVCVLLALHFAGGEGRSFGDNDVILLLVLALVLFCLFAYSQYVNSDVAMLPFRVVKHRSVLAGFWFITCASSSLIVMTYFLPLWYQTIKDTSAQQSGIGLLPMLVAVIVGVFGSGALVSLIGYYTPFMLASSVLMPIGLGLLTTIGPDTSRAALLAYPVIFGLGNGMGFQQPLIGVQAVLPQADVATGTSVIVFGQSFGGAIMLAAGETIFQSRLLQNLASYLGLHNTSTHELLGNGPASLQVLVPTEKLPVLIQAVSASFTQTFYLALALASLSIFGSVFMGWKSVKPPKRPAQGDAAVSM